VFAFATFEDITSALRAAAERPETALDIEEEMLMIWLSIQD
jgi:hypothetical protein